MAKESDKTADRMEEWEECKGQSKEESENNKRRQNTRENIALDEKKIISFSLQQYKCNVNTEQN